jgi:hypothetical protein
MSIVTAPQPRSQAPHVHRLGGYRTHEDAIAREIVSVRSPDGTVLVLDRLSDTLSDARLVARLTPQEPSENARIVCEMYLADETRGRCRLLTAADYDSDGPADPPTDLNLAALDRAPLCDAEARLHSIRMIAPRDSFPELRWTRWADHAQDTAFEVVTLRDVIAAVEDYEPARTMTGEMLGAYGDDELLSTSRLASELERVTDSPIVLNRGLREAVEKKIASAELTLSEIAVRCGRTKRDRRGTLSGETSWLTRRIGAAPEGGEAEPTRWVHTDTLALIAREGLGLSPNEVEL